MLATLGAAETVTPDLPGFGEAAAFSPPELDAYAAYFAALGNTRWIGIGHSMGAKIALAAAAKRPSSLVGLVLIAPSPPTPEQMSDDARSKCLAEHGDRAAAAADLAAISALPASLLAGAIDDKLRVDAATWRWWYARGSRDDISVATARIDIPVLVITGDNDKVMGPATAPEVAGALPNARLEKIGGGHLLPLEAPDAVAAAIHRFVAGIG